MLSLRNEKCNPVLEVAQRFADLGLVESVNAFFAEDTVVVRRRGKNYDDGGRGKDYF